MSETTNNSVIAQQPLQVRKVSQLKNYLSYDGLSYTNSYILIGYPSKDATIPHNYKISLEDIKQISYSYISDILTSQFSQALEEEILKVRQEYDEKLAHIMGYITDIIGTHPDISAYWNKVGDYIKQYYGKDYIDEVDKITTIDK